MPHSLPTEYVLYLRSCHPEHCGSCHSERSEESSCGRRRRAGTACARRRSDYSRRSGWRLRQLGPHGPQTDAPLPAARLSLSTSVLLRPLQAVRPFAFNRGASDYARPPKKDFCGHGNSLFCAMRVNNLLCGQFNAPFFAHRVRPYSSVYPA